MALSQAYVVATDAQFKELSNFSLPPRAGRILAIEASGQVRIEMDDPDGGDVLAWPLNGFIYAVGDVVYVAFAVNSPDSAIVVGSRAPLPTLDPGVIGGGFVELDGSTPLTGDWDAGSARRISVGRLGLTAGAGAGPVLDFVSGFSLTEGANTFNTGFFAGATADAIAFTIVRGLAANAMMGTGVNGDSFRRLIVQADGALLWGSGAVARDTNLYRNGGNELKTDDALLVALQLRVGLDSIGATNLGVRAGTSSNDAAVGGVLFVDTVTAGNVGTGEDDLSSYSVPANTLSANGMSLWFEAWGSMAVNANAKTLRVRFGTSGVNEVLNRSMVVSSVGPWHVRGRIVRTGASAEKSIAQVLDGTQQQVANVTTLNQANNTATTFKVTGEATANNDIVIEGCMVGWDVGYSSFLFSAQA